jgi:Mrp family chromosome partitioning ATPase
MFDRWRTQYDVILIDSPPILAVGDAQILAQMADYSVVVARWGSTSWSALNQASRLLWESGAQIAGVTVSRANVRQLKSYQYADSKVYGPAYGHRMHERET